MWDNYISLIIGNKILWLKLRGLYIRVIWVLFNLNNMEFDDVKEWYLLYKLCSKVMDDYLSWNYRIFKFRILISCDIY